MMFKAKDKVEVNEKETFGVLKFLGLGQERRDYNEDTGEIGEVERRTYDLVSTKLARVVEVHIPKDVPIINLPFETEVRLIDLDIRGYNVRGRSGFTVRANGIEPIKKESPKTGNK